MIVGLQTEFCLDATVESAFDRGYKVYLPHGTNSTFDRSEERRVGKECH